MTIKEFLICSAMRLRNSDDMRGTGLNEMKEKAEDKIYFWNKEKIDKYGTAMAVVIHEIQKIDNDYCHKTKSHFIRFIEQRLKTEESIAQKVERKHRQGEDWQLEEHISDLAGVRVICFDIDQIYLLAKQLRKSDHFEILKEKDYVRKPKDNGYQSYHMIIGIDGIKVELQIRTILMDAWSSLDSILVYKKNTPISNEMKRDIHKIAKWSRKMDKMVAGMIEHKNKF